jgi:hypothetical protein
VEETKAMKNLVIVLSLVLGAWTLSPTSVAHASWSSGWSWIWSWWGGGDSDHRHSGGDSYSGRKGNGGAVPELDPSSAGGAIVLLLGGVAYIASRRREEDLV